MDLNWIITANAGRARFFAEATPTSRLQEFTDMVNPAARLRTVETEADRIGPTAAGKSAHNTGAPTPHKTYQPPTMPAEHESELFAKNIAAYLLQALQEKRFEHLIVAASPDFLGVLRQCLDPRLLAVLSLSIDKDYTQHSADQLHAQLDAHGRARHGAAGPSPGGDRKSVV
jgi:protein required for attachment to host cells